MNDVHKQVIYTLNTNLQIIITKYLNKLLISNKDIIILYY